MKKLAPLSCGLLLVLAGSLCAAETALIDTHTPWRTYLVVGPSLRWQNGAENVWPSKGGGQLRVGRPGAKFPPFDPATADLDKLGFSPRPPADWMKAAGDVSAWSRYLMGDLTASDTAGWMSLISLHGGGSPEALRREIYRYYPLQERRELVERLLDRGVLAVDDETSRNRQPGRCCPVGCQVPETPRLDGSDNGPAQKALPNAAE